MNVVIDTNVIVSGLLNPNGLPTSILNLFFQDSVRLLIDNRIIEEYKNVLLRPKFMFNKTDVYSLIDYIERTGQYIFAKPTFSQFTDPHDKKFYEVGIDGNAMFLITGNSKLFPAEHWIVSPKAFINEIAKGTT